MPYIFILSGLVFAALGLNLLRLPQEQRTLLSLLAAIIVFSVSIFIFICGIVLLPPPHS